jgi:hypothetical protein
MDICGKPWRYRPRLLWNGCGIGVDVRAGDPLRRMGAITAAAANVTGRDGVGAVEPAR